MLLRNYRSHSRLLELPSRLFYSHSLVASAASEAVRAPAWSELTAPDPHDDAADSQIDLANAPAKGYLETLLEELTRGKQGGKADVSDASVDSPGGGQVGVAGAEASPGKGHATLDESAQGDAADVDSLGKADAAMGTKEGRMHGDPHGLDEANAGALEALAQEYADGDVEDASSNVEQAGADEFEEQLPTNTLFYGVAGKQVGQ